MAYDEIQNQIDANSKIGRPFNAQTLISDEEETDTKNAIDTSTNDRQPRTHMQYSAAAMPEATKTSDELFSREALQSRELKE